MEIPKLTVGSIMYHLSNSYNSELEPYLYLDKFEVIEVTRSGAWVMSCFDASIYRYRLAAADRKAALKEFREKKRLRWVSTDSWNGKRWCYPTVEMAAESLLRRKERQLRILQSQIASVERVLEYSDKIKNVRAYDFLLNSTFLYVSKIPDEKNRPHQLLLENK